LEWRWGEAAAGGEPGIDFLRQELLEFSCVPVPANPDALIQARAKGIDTAPMVSWAERVLDGEPGTRAPLPRRKLERLAKAADGRSPRVFHLSGDQQVDLARRNLSAMRAQDEAGGGETLDRLESAVDRLERLSPPKADGPVADTGKAADIAAAVEASVRTAMTRITGRVA
jgi:hypothetical protein